jgi:hypothetical protein
MARTSRVPFALAALALSLSAAASASATPAPRAAGALRFVVTYSGSGTWRTTYHSEPPNPGANHDTNDAHDSSSQRWSLRFQRVLTVASCGGTGSCPVLLRGARGAAAVTARIDHIHRDGAIAADSTSVRCHLRSTNAMTGSPQAAILVRYAPRRNAVVIVARDPVIDALTVLPRQCPQQGDSIDGLLDSYATPGFSFAPGWGPDRWLSSRPAVIPLSRLRHASRVRIRLGPAPAGIPPRGCAVHDPAIERCHTGGSWRGVLTLTALA